MTPAMGAEAQITNLSERPGGATQRLLFYRIVRHTLLAKTIPVRHADETFL